MKATEGESQRTKNGEEAHNCYQTEKTKSTDTRTGLWLTVVVGCLNTVKSFPVNLSVRSISCRVFWWFYSNQCNLYLLQTWDQPPPMLHALEIYAFVELPYFVDTACFYWLKSKWNLLRACNGILLCYTNNSSMVLYLSWKEKCVFGKYLI